MEFHINQDIVCIKTHSKKKVIEGQIYVAKALKQGVCKCSKVLVDVGIANNDLPNTLYKACGTCGDNFFPFLSNDGIWWINVELFKPLDELCNIDELTEVLNEPLYK